ncbi:17737_t:CDS:2, partial [Funneliformis geosporum]
VEDDSNVSGILERSYDVPQIHLRNLLNGISYNDITDFGKNDMLSSIKNTY